MTYNFVNACWLPVEHDVVWEEGGQQQFDQPDGQPQHEQHDRAEHNHGQDEPPQVSVDGQVNHLLHRVKIWVIEVSQKPQHSRPQHLMDIQPSTLGLDLFLIIKINLQ